MELLSFTSSASTSNLMALAVALICAGLIMGFVSGLLGIGGGGILVPVLFDVFGFLGVNGEARMHLAIGTSLAVMIPTSIRSFAAHRAKGSADFDLVKRLAPWVVLGVAAGSLTAHFADGRALRWVWVFCGGLLAVKFLFGRDDWRLGAEIPKGPGINVYGALVGFLSTLMSIGGGAFVTTMMTLYGRSILQAVGTASGFGPLIAVPGALGFVWAGWNVANLPPGSLGYVSLLGAALIVPASVFAAPWGVRAAHGISRRKLEIAFGCCLALISTRFLLSLL